MKLPSMIRWMAAGAVVALAGCGGRGTVTVVPAGAIQDNFFATWEIDSAQFGPVDCVTVGAATVDMDIVNVNSGQRFVYSFACAVYQGQSGPIDVGQFDVLLNLTDPSGGVIDQVNVGAENVSQAGTIDLGHVLFRVP